MINKNFKKISILLTSLILLLTIIIAIYTVNYIDFLRREFIGEQITKINCTEKDNIQIKQILKDYYNNKIIENGENNDLIKDIYNNDNITIKKASTWMDFNNRKYKITYSLNGKNNEYEFNNDSIGKLYDYIQENKIEYKINYNYIYIVLWSSFFILIIVKVILNFYKRPE